MYCKNGLHRFGWEHWQKIEEGYTIRWCLECGEKIGEFWIDK